MTEPKMSDEEQAELEQFRDLVPAPWAVSAGYFVVRDGQVWVTPSGMEWLRSILPLIDAGEDPCHPTRPQ